MRDVLCPTTLIVGNGDVNSRGQAEELAKKYKLDGSSDLRAQFMQAGSTDESLAILQAAQA